MDNHFHFSPNLFWDVDVQTLDFNVHARFLIERVLTRGLINDWFELTRLYSFEQIKEEAIKIRYLDKLTLNFCSILLNTPKSEFRCYKQPQSTQQLWPY